MMATYGGVPGGGREKSVVDARRRGGGERDVDTSGIPCMFFQRGSCRAGESCKYSHGGRLTLSGRRRRRRGDDVVNEDAGRFL